MDHQPLEGLSALISRPLFAEIFDQGRRENVLIRASGFSAECLEPDKQGRFQLYGLHYGPFFRCFVLAFMR